MYIPKYFQLSDQQEAVNFMQRYSFATIISADNDIPVATHLPFLIETRVDKIVLCSHFAKANPQASALIDKCVLVIFTEPHAYISPTNYEKQTNVPTWNYLAVHGYGKAVLLSQGEQTVDLLAQMIINYEPAYLQQWDSLPNDYKQNMANGIIAFEIIVDDLQGKQKLSQNRSAIERDNIINSLNKAGNSNEREIAAYMEKSKN